MPTLLACLSSGKGTWTEVVTIMNSQPWTKVFLFVNAFGRENFKAHQPNVEIIHLDEMKSVSELVEEIKRRLQGKIRDWEIALNIISGNGKEHMALLEAVLELGLNFRLITLQNGKVEVLGLR